MTYLQLLMRLQKLNAKQLAQKVTLYEGCSGNWDSLTCVEIADEDIWREGEEPDTERHKTLSQYGPVKPGVSKGGIYLLHDH